MPCGGHPPWWSGRHAPHHLLPLTPLCNPVNHRMARSSWWFVPPPPTYHGSLNGSCVRGLGPPMQSSTPSPLPAAGSQCYRLDSVAGDVHRAIREMEGAQIPLTSLHRDPASLPRNALLKDLAPYRCILRTIHIMYGTVRYRHHIRFLTVPYICACPFSGARRAKVQEHKARNTIHCLICVPLSSRAISHVNFNMRCPNVWPQCVQHSQHAWTVALRHGVAKPAYAIVRASHCTVLGGTHTLVVYHCTP